MSDALKPLARAAGPCVVLVVGEPGIGKTTLIDVATRRAFPLGCLHLAGVEPARQIPFGAAAELFDLLVARSPEGARLARLLGGDETESGRLEPLRVFEATRAALFALAPTLVVFDDMQWADDASVSLCQYLVRSASADRRSLGFVFASRPGRRVAAARRALQGGARLLAEVTLGAMHRVDGIALARSIDPALTTEQAEQLYASAAGSPFWIETLARRAAGGGMRDADLTHRLTSVSGDEAECLAAITVTARPVTQAELAALLGWPPARLEWACTRLVDTGLVVTSGPGLRVAHDLIRETAYQQIPEHERMRLHRRVAESLERDSDGDLHVLTEAMAHRTVVGSPPLTLALRIAGSPQRRLLGSEGFDQLAAVADGSSYDDDEARTLRVELAGLASELGDRQASYDRWLVLADRLPTHRERAAAAIEAARQAVELQRPADAAYMLERARSFGAGDDWTSVEADALDHVWRLWLDHDPTAGRPRLEAALGRARDLVAQAGGVDALDRRARRAFVTVLAAAWDVALTDDAADAMREIADERVVATRGLGEEHLVAAKDAARVLWWQGRWEEAAVELGAVLEEARRQVYPVMVADLCHLVAFNEYTLGRLDRAIELLDERDALLSRLGDRLKNAAPWTRAGLRQMIEASRGDWRESVTVLQAQAAAESSPHRRLGLRQVAATTAARFGGPAHAMLVRLEVEAAVADADAGGCRRCWWDIVLSSAECHVRIGDQDVATRYLAQWDAAHPTSHTRYVLERDWVEALIRAATSDPAGQQGLRRLITSTRSCGRRMDEVWAGIDLGRVQAAADTGQAGRTWMEAAEVASAIGATTELRVLQQELRHIGARTNARLAGQGTTALGLSARELEVARLAASGRRNGEIAQALFLSPKTVERHLSSIFGKLGVRNRAELVAQYAGQLGRSEEGSRSSAS